MEFFDIVDEEGRPTGKTVERKEAHLTGTLHRTSHVWILRKNAGKTEVLLQRRCMQKDSFPGCYDISSAGHIPAGVDYVPSAIRELKEELGLEAKGEELVDCGNHRMSFISEFHGIPFHDEQFSKVFILWRDVEVEDLVLQPEEIDGAKWIPFEDLMTAVSTNRYQNKEFFHCIDIEELKILKEHIK